MSNIKRRQRNNAGRHVDRSSKNKLIGQEMDEMEGDGLFSVIKNIGSKVVSKVTSKAGKELIKKTIKTTADKAIDSGSKKLGEKLGVTVAEKIGNTIDEVVNNPAAKSKLENFENKGEEIKKALLKIDSNVKSKPSDTEQLSKLITLQIKDRFNKLI